MTELAIIGGTGLTALNNLTITHREELDTPYGKPSGPLSYGEIAGKKVIFMPRHGAEHTIPPHKINYRANIWALKNAGVKRVIAVAAVGGISEDMEPAALAVPDQIIDYTSGRVNTFFEEDLTEVTHIDFTYPYSEGLRKLILSACLNINIDVCAHGVYGATQGPRLETMAEINRMERDGCTLVGMTGMPEAALARELDLEYACLAVVANWAAGKSDGEIITMDDIEKVLKEGMAKVRQVLEQVLLQA